MSAIGRIAGLHDTKTRELRAIYVGLFGHEPRSRNRAWLIKRIAWRLQEREWGGLTDRALRRIDEVAADAPIRHRVPKGWSP